MNGPDGTPLVHRMPFGAELHRNGTRFRLWAPSQERIELMIEGQREPVGMSETPGTAGMKSWSARRAPARVIDFALRMECWSPTRHRGSNLKMSMAQAKWSIRRCSNGDIRHGPGGPGMKPFYTNCTSAHSPKRAPSRGSSIVWVICRARHYGYRANAGGRFPRRAATGATTEFCRSRPTSATATEDLKAVVDAAHGMSLMVFLTLFTITSDPTETTYRDTPRSLHRRHQDAMGRGRQLRRRAEWASSRVCYPQRALLAEGVHLDGLRLDAVHAIMDDSPKHLLKEIGERVSAECGGQRHVHLMCWKTKRTRQVGYRGRARCTYRPNGMMMFITAFTRPPQESVPDITQSTRAILKLARSLAEGFAFQGELMDYRGEPRGEPSAHLPPTAFISFMQNHDQVGNRAFGDRITDTPRRRSARYRLHLSTGSPNSDAVHGGRMGDRRSVSFLLRLRRDSPSRPNRSARRIRRFPEFQDEQARQQIPDPTAESTFSRKAFLGFSRQPANADWLQWYRTILSVRQSLIVPIIPECGPAYYEVLGRGEVIVSWPLQQALLLLHANLADAAGHELRRTAARVVWHEGTENSDHRQGPWSVTWLMAPKDTAA